MYMMNIDEETAFWIIFLIVVVGETLLFWLSGVFDTITTTGGLVIFTLMYVLTGVALRHWVKDGMRF
jgi:hypothetical protein